MDNNILSLLGTKATSALIIVFFINWLKKSKFMPLINFETSKLNHLIAVIVTGLGTLGIKFAYSSQEHTLLITGLSATAILSGVWSWVQNYVLTKTAYHLMADKINPKPDDKIVVPVVSVQPSSTVVK